MSFITIFLTNLISNTVILYLITNFLLDLNTNTSLRKAFITILIVELFKSFIGFITKTSFSFHADVFYNIFIYLLIIPQLIFVKIIYSMTWKDAGYYFICSWLAGIFIYPLAFKLISLIF